MGKWNKASSQAPSEEFKQNEERRRQLIIEAAKRRREKQKKLQQLNQEMKRKEEQALQKHIQEKKQAYNRYLKPSIPKVNMHDKYEQNRRTNKIANAEQREVSKWKKRGKSEEKFYNESKNDSFKKEKSNLQDQQDKPKPIKISETTKQAQNDFEKEWGQEPEIVEDLIGSKLLDSLDLDIDTITRGNGYNQQLKQQEIWKKQEIDQQNNDVQEIKELIGYDSMLLSIDERDKQAQITVKQKRDDTKPSNKKQKKQVNEQEAFNELKNKKEGKLLSWTKLETVEEADDLFSNCTSNKNISKMSENKSHEKNTSSKKILSPIPQQKNKSTNKSKQNIRTNQRSKSIDRKPNLPAAAAYKPKQVDKQVKKPNQSARETESQQMKRKNLTRIRQTSQNRSNSIQKPKSQEKPRHQKVEQPKKAPKTQNNFKQANNPPKPAYSVQNAKNEPTCSVVTHQQFFDVQSFIKNDLVHLNQQQYELQKQIRQLHLDNKEKVKEVEEKYEIRKDYKTSQNLMKHLENPDHQSQVYLYSKNVDRTEDQLEDSIQRLDDLLIKNQIKSESKRSNLLEGSSHSIIDPMSQPEDFQQQILKLAENISRFEQEPDPEIKGYGQMRKQKKKKVHEVNEQIVCESKHFDEISEQKKPMRMPQPPLLQYSKKSNSIDVMKNEQEEEFEDSLETMGRIQVNEKLRNILFD